jgi:hypothetical protein
VATVVEFIAAKASPFNSLQRPENFLMLNLKEFREERRVEHLVPNQIHILVELR